MNTWYDSLEKSPLTPPSEVFPIAWGILYFLIFLSLILYIRNGAKNLPLFFFSINIILNFLWSPVFFILHDKIAAFLIILFMILTLIPTIYWFFQKSKPAGVLLLPYLFWLFFALYLNWEIIAKN